MTLECLRTEQYTLVITHFVPWTGRGAVDVTAPDELAMRGEPLCSREGDDEIAVLDLPDGIVERATLLFVQILK